MQPLGGPLQSGRCLFFYGDHRHFYAPAARAFQHEKRKLAIAGDKPPITRMEFAGGGHRRSYFTRPRSADSIKRINVKTSSESDKVPRIFSTACVVLSFER